MKYRWRSSNANVDLLQSKRSRTIQMGTWGLITSQGKVQPLLFSQLVNYLAQVECPGFSRTNGLQYLDTVLSSRLPWGTGDNVSNQLLKLQWSMTQIWKKSIGWSILRPSSEAQCWAALAKCCRTADRRPDNLCRWGLAITISLMINPDIVKSHG